MKRSYSETRQRFSIKKLKIGAASVLVGTVFAAFANQVVVHADDEIADVATAEKVASITENPDLSGLEHPVTDLPTDEVEKVIVDKIEEESTPDNSVDQPQNEETELIARTSSSINNAQKRPENEGQPMVSGLGFRTTNSTDVIEDSANNYKKYEEQNLARLKDTITWVDFSKATNLKQITYDGKQYGALQVGTVFEQEIVPGVNVKFTVKELKPFDATEEFKKRVEGTEDANLYQPDLKNLYLDKPTLTYLVFDEAGKRVRLSSDEYTSGPGYTYIPTEAGKVKIEGYRQAGLVPQDAEVRLDYLGNVHIARQGQPIREAEIVVDEIDPKYSRIQQAGYDVPGKVTLHSLEDGANVGAIFSVEATYYGQKIPANVVVADSEEAGLAEMNIYTTKGRPWELFTEITKPGTVNSSYQPLTHDNRLWWLSNTDYIGIVN